MLSGLLFQAGWRQKCVLYHRKNAPSDRTANPAQGRAVECGASGGCCLLSSRLFLSSSLSHMYFWLLM